MVRKYGGGGGVAGNLRKGIRKYLERNENGNTYKTNNLRRTLSFNSGLTPRFS